MDISTGEWLGSHFLQTVRPFVFYLRAVRFWMDAHPTEIVVMWISREGNAGAKGREQYPDASGADEGRLWDDVVEAFDGLLLDRRVSSLGGTTLKDLIRRDHRAVVFVSDLDGVAGSSRYLAQDGASVENFWIGEGAFGGEDTFHRQREYFRTAALRNRDAEDRGGYTLMGMNTAGQGFQVEGAAARRFLPWPLSERRDLSENCASRTNIPGLSDWCPETLLDVAQLGSYYDQIVLDGAYREAVVAPSSPSAEGTTAFPHALYLDALDYGGTIRTGTTTLFGAVRGGGGGDPTPGEPNGDSAYAYVDTVIAYNVRRACGGRGGGRSTTDGGILVVAPDIAAAVDGNDGDGTLPTATGGSGGPSSSSPSSNRGGGANDGGCAVPLKRYLEGRRRKHPLRLWNDPKRGRRDDWPPERMSSSSSSSLRSQIGPDVPLRSS